MTNTFEMQLRKVAFGLSALLLLQLVWVGGKLWLQSEPEAITPAESSLAVEHFQNSPDLNENSLEGLAARPLFWEGRQPYLAPIEPEEVEEYVIESGSSKIDDVELLGTYGIGSQSGVIVAYKGEKRRLRENESIAGWQFTMLSDKGAMFESGDQIKQLKMKHAESDLSKLPPEPAAGAESAGASNNGTSTWAAAADEPGQVAKADKKKNKDKRKKNKNKKKNRETSSSDNNDKTGQ